MYKVSIDLGGTNTRVCLVDGVDVLKKESFATISDPIKNFERVIEILDDYKIGKEEVINIGSPGPLNPNTGELGHLPNLEHFGNFNIKEFFSNK